MTEHASARSEYPVVPVDVGRLDLSVPLGWVSEPSGPPWRWLGQWPGEGLVVTALDVGGRRGDLRAWVETPMKVLGGPDPDTLPFVGQTRVLEWSGALPVLTGLDEVVGFTGLVVWETEQRPELLRSYVLAARRGDEAWKVGLTLSSALLPGSPMDRVDAEDHARARSCLGDLSFV